MISHGMNKEIGEFVIARSANIARNIFDLRLEKAASLEVDMRQSLKILKTCIELVGKALIEGNEAVRDDVSKYSVQVGQNAIKSGQSLDIATETVSLIRKAIWQQIELKMGDLMVTFHEASVITMTIGSIIDDLMYGFSLAYVEAHEQLIKAYQFSIEELSVPVVPIFDGVAILPLIGDIDTNRFKIMMEQVLEKSSRLNLSCLVIDLSGVSVVDTVVAHHLFQLTDTLLLLGIQTTITGISPAIAKTAISLNINLEKLTIRTNLRQALERLGFGSNNN